MQDENEEYECPRCGETVDAYSTTCPSCGCEFSDDEDFEDES